MGSIHTGSRGGQALIMVTLSLIFLFSTMGLAVDLGWCYYLKARVQTAADAAASAAAVWAANNHDTCSSGCGTAYTCSGAAASSAVTAGCLYAAQNGPPGVSASLIENLSSTTSAGVSGNTPYIWIQATVSTTSPLQFLYLSGFQSASISASAIAGVSLTNNGSCVYILGSGSSVLSISGTGSLKTTACGIYVASSSAQAINVTGSATICSGVSGSNCTGSIWVGGNTGGPGTASTYDCYEANPNLIKPTCTASQTVTDPLSYLTMPTAGACTKTNYSLTNANTDTLGTDANSGGFQGTYCGGISVVGTATLTLKPGTYVMLGGGFSTGNSAKIIGTGVTIYNTADGTHSAGAIAASGSSTMTLSAPTSGTYMGMLFMQDSAVTTGASFGNSAVMNTSGTYYFPNASVSLSGTQSSAVNQALVVKSLTITGSANLLQDSSSTGQYTGLDIHAPSLIQ